ncbi:hypothetical protein HJC23_008809 [Cyclotella cryptica]|uniref:Uncharacterized protein n=1 Tax=Cyclotella cryptica TaxID=29204 RepID=A0ABD3QA86_9STRA|eukprot:CCRYP_007453-RA/>CCRYP_007453-RA protein AED:0.00 eAED:0.00 QI:183/-1/1/1/-1/1/1/237/173
MKIATSVLFAAFAAPVISFNPSRPRFDVTNTFTSASYDTTVILFGTNHRRRDVLTIGPLFVTAALGFDSRIANAMEEKVYSSNARNLMRLSSGDSSGGSVYDNNPSSPKARRRRAMVGCKNTSARSLAGKMIGKSNLNEKDCNMLVMEGDGTFMLEALTELDCPTCPYGIASR